MQSSPLLGPAWSGAACRRRLVLRKRPQTHRSLRLPAFVPGSFNTAAGEVLLFLCVASRLKFNFITLHIKKELLQQFRGSVLTHLQKHDRHAANQDQRFACSGGSGGIRCFYDSVAAICTC